jgi:hypothetical protein
MKAEEEGKVKEEKVKEEKDKEERKARKERRRSGSKRVEKKEEEEEEEEEEEDFILYDRLGIGRPRSHRQIQHSSQETPLSGRRLIALSPTSSIGSPTSPPNGKEIMSPGEKEIMLLPGEKKGADATRMAHLLLISFVFIVLAFIAIWSFFRENM